MSEIKQNLVNFVEDLTNGSFYNKDFSVDVINYVLCCVHGPGSGQYLAEESSFSEYPFLMRDIKLFTFSPELLNWNLDKN